MDDNPIFKGEISMASGNKETKTDHLGDVCLRQCRVYHWGLWDFLQPIYVVWREGVWLQHVVIGEATRQFFQCPKRILFHLNALGAN